VISPVLDSRGATLPRSYFAWVVDASRGVRTGAWVMVAVTCALLPRPGVKVTRKALSVPSPL
jgi:hypothetical protein